MKLTEEAEKITEMFNARVRPMRGRLNVRTPCIRLGAENRAWCAL